MTRPAFHTPTLEASLAAFLAPRAPKVPIARSTPEQMAAARAAARAPRNATMASKVEALASLPADLSALTDAQITSLIYDAMSFYTQDDGYEVAQIANCRLHDERTRRDNDLEADLASVALKIAAE